MMTWIKSHRRSAVLVGVTIIVPLYLFLTALGALLSARADYMGQIEAIEPRLARMQGLIVKEDELRASLGAVSTIVGDHIYPKGTAPAAVAASMQAEGRRILGDAGMDVTNSQVLRPRKRNQFDYVAVKIVARGSLEQLDAGLTEFAQFRPVIFIESLDAFPNRRRRRDEPESQILTVSLQLLSLRSVL